MKSEPSKSERTRQRIRDAAAKLFAARGYERTTVRDIAEMAEIDPTMIIRYFGSKDGLFAETAGFDLSLPDIVAVPPHRLGEVAVRHFLSRWEGGSEQSGLAVLLRSAASNEMAAARMRDLFASQIMPMLAVLSPGRDTEHLAALVASQMLGLAFCRYILKLEPIASMTIDEVVALVSPNLQSILAGSDALGNTSRNET